MRPATDPPGAEMLLRERAWLRRLVGSLVHGSDADDVAQDVAVAALSRPPHHTESLRGWLATVARRAVGRRQRRSELAAAAERTAARPEVEPSPHDVLARAEAHRRVVEAVLALEEPYRTVILLRFFDGRETSGIAHALGCPVATVRTRLVRAQQRLRARLESSLGRPAHWAALFGWQAAPAAGSMLPTTGVVLMTTQTKAVLAGVLVLALAVSVILFGGGGTPSLDGTTPQPPAVATTAAESLARTSMPAAPRVRSTPREAPERASTSQPASVIPASVPGEGILVYVHDIEGRPAGDASVWEARTPVVLRIRTEDTGSPGAPAARRLELLAAAPTLADLATEREPAQSGASAAGSADLPESTLEARGPRLLAKTDARGVCRVAMQSPAQLIATTDDGMISTLTTADDSARFVALCVDEGERIQGEVTGDAGRHTPAAVHVIFWNPATGGRRTCGEAVFGTDDSGRFACVLPGQSCCAFAAASGDLRSRWQPLDRRGVSTLQLRLRPQSEVAGTVLDPYGLPCAEATVQADVLQIRSQRGWLEVYAARAMTGADGSYRLLVPGTGRILATVHHPRWAPAEPTPIEVGPGQTRADFRLALWGHMIGEVRWSDGRPIAGATVTIQREASGVVDARSNREEHETSVRVDTRGLYEIGEILANGLYTVTCIPDPARPSTRSVRRGVPPGTQSFTFDEASLAGASLTIRLETPEGAPFDGEAEITVLDERRQPSPPERVRGDAQGRVTVGRLAKGKPVWLGIVTHRHARTVHGPFVPGEEAPAVLRLQQACPLEVLVVTQSGRAAAGVTVSIGRADVDRPTVRLPILRTDECGVVSVADLEPGTYLVHAEVGRDARASARVTLPSDGPTILKLSR